MHLRRAVELIRITGRMEAAGKSLVAMGDSDGARPISKALQPPTEREQQAPREMQVFLRRLANPKT